MSLLNIGVSALTTTQASLATTSHNISNVNTEGYSRQRVDQVTYTPNFQGTHYIGSGVTVGGVERIFNEFLATQVRTYTSQESQQDTFLTFASQVDDLMGSENLGLNSGMESFFNAVHEVSNDPTSISARQVLLTEAELLANRFNTLDQQLEGFDKQVDNLLSTAVKDVNTLSRGIAELNEAIIAGTSSSGAVPNDLMDRRDQLINELSKYLSVSTLPEDSGAINVFVGTGQALVVGTSQIDLHEIVDTSTNPNRISIGYGSSQADISAQLTGGSIGGAFQVRADVIDASRTELDSLALGIATNMNTQHQRGLTLDGTVGGEFFSIPTLPTTVDAGNISLALSDPRDIAVAFPMGVTNSSASTGTAQIDIASIDTTTFPITLPYSAPITLTFNNATNQYTVTRGADSNTFAYNPAVDSGATIDLATVTAAWAAPVEMSLTVSGVPGNGDVTTLSASAAIGDNRNALAMADLQTAKLLNAGTQSFADSYGVLVANVATRTHQADVGQQTQQGLLDQVELRYESTSGVNLDEEAANLIRYQQAYQAASQIITVSNTIFNALINAI
ncbi:flagellar hook-associated protein FlgK [Methylophaga sp. 41_12_T18]|nr:flagellar hook-associated protein FlgK [Methylophaga sp. 41_12_T18]